MNRKDLISHCLSYTGAVEDYPFEDMNSTVLRHGKSKKWFALIFEKDGNLCVNLKCEPMEDVVIDVPEEFKAILKDFEE